MPLRIGPQVAATRAARGKPPEQRLGRALNHEMEVVRHQDMREQRHPEGNQGPLELLIEGVALLVLPQVPDLPVDLLRG